jgi:hypothetical protein
MVSEEGDPIFADCDGCHRILWQGDGGTLAMSSPGEGQPFLHPEDGEPMEEFSDCTECHTGGAELYE